MSASDDPVELLVPPQNFDLTSLADTRERVKHIALGLGLDASTSAGFVTAVSEALTNAIRHGGQLRTMSLTIADNHLRVDITDNGTAGSLTVPRQPPSPEEDQGRGLWIMSQYARVDCTTGPAGTTVTLRIPLNRDDRQSRTPSSDP